MTEGETPEAAAHAKHDEPHAGGEHEGKSPGHGRAIGLTMALLGVLLAICAALVGSERTRLLATLVEQANKLGLEQAESTKLRVIETDRELLHAVTPSKREVAKFEGALKDVRGHTGKADDEDTAELKDMIDVSTRSIADVLTPDPEDLARFDDLRGRYRRDYAEAKEDAEAYDGAIEAHAQAAEGFERAQLCFEVGIVVASIALLTMSRGAWALAIAIGIAGLGIGGRTWVRTRDDFTVAEQKIEAAKKNTARIEDGAEDGPADPDAPAPANPPRSSPP